VTLLAPHLQAFFADRLIRQKQASPHTIAAYRDTWRLLLAYAGQQAGKPPSRLDIADLGAEAVTGFLDHLERDRGCTARTRNARLAAIRSLFSYLSTRCPEHAGDIARILSVPAKRCDSTIVGYLSEPEVTALLAAPDPATWTGRRDRALLHTAVTTGLRASELTGLTCADVHLGTGSYVACKGKGRKDRITPVSGNAAAALRSWLDERSGKPADPVFCTRRGTAMSTDALADRVAVHAARAAVSCPSLTSKNVSPHVLRHTAAMRLQRRGVASDATFRRLGEDGGVRVPALPGVQRLGGLAAGHAAGAGVPVPSLHLMAGCGIKISCIR
jgi:site-specific recombinase XerD